MPQNVSVLEWLKRVWLPIASFVGAVSLVYNFFQIWRGDQKTVTWIVAALSYCTLCVLLSVVAFSTRRSTLAIVDSSATRTSRYPSLYKFARAGLVLLALFLALPLVFLRGTDCKSKDKVLVLVADFDGPETTHYRITEKIIVQLRQSMLDYRDTLILPLGKTISEQQGSNVAQELGESKCATLVLWGWYGVTDSDALLTIHVENLRAFRTPSISQSELYSAKSSITELHSFHFQERLSKEMSAFTLFITGLIRAQADDYAEAVRRFSAALDAGEWPENLITRVLVYLNRGIARLRLARYDEALTDLSLAILINPKYAPSYNVRGAIYTTMHDFPHAMSDYSQAIELDPGAAVVYHNRAYAHSLAGDYEKVLDDTSKAIELEPGIGYSTYYLRGSAEQILGDHKNAITDFSEVIRQKPHDDSGYYGRARSYVASEDFNSAIADISQSIRINPHETLYFSLRGTAYYRAKQYQKALTDFTQAIELNGKNFFAYSDRSSVFGELGQYDKGVEDLRKTLEILDTSDDTFEGLIPTTVEFDRTELRKSTQELLDVTERLKRTIDDLNLSTDQLHQLQEQIKR
jgi:tetratricopeptide (TPR) repeat protein